MQNCIVARLPAASMSRIGRNDPCHCGSGKKYKACHGDLRVPEVTIPDHVLKEVRERERRWREFRGQHGDAKALISAEVNGTRFVAAGQRLLYGRGWKTFHDFLNGYLGATLGSEWGAQQVKMPFKQQHPVVQWHTLMAMANARQGPDSDGLWTLTTGAANAWRRLAYDLYLIEHNSELRGRLLRRLREPRTFQAARFELAVAAMMVAGGYELKYSNERGPGKHPEFHAYSASTGLSLAVEAKSRHRPGVLGHGGEQKPSAPDVLRLDGLLLEAAKKDTAAPLLVFIEVNCPTYGEDAGGDITAEIAASWARVQAHDWPRGFPTVGAVFYNDVSPWYLDEPLIEGRQNLWLQALWPTKSRHEIDVQRLIRDLARACIQRANVPLTFPDR